MEFLSNPIVPIAIGLVSLLLSALVPILIFHKQKLRKEITCIVSPRLDGGDYDLLTLRLCNSGNVQIEPDDYLTPITLSFRSEEILGFGILEQTPEDLRPSVILTDQLTIEPLLLNPQDSLLLVLKNVRDKTPVYTTSYKEFKANVAAGKYGFNVRVHARISGVQEVKVMYGTFVTSPFVTIAGMLALLGFGVLLPTLFLLGDLSSLNDTISLIQSLVPQTIQFFQKGTQDVFPILLELVALIIYPIISLLYVAATLANIFINPHMQSLYVKLVHRRVLKAMVSLNVAAFSKSRLLTMLYAEFEVEEALEEVEKSIDRLLIGAKQSAASFVNVTQSKSR